MDHDHDHDHDYPPSLFSGRVASALFLFLFFSLLSLHLLLLFLFAFQHFTSAFAMPTDDLFHRRCGTWAPARRPMPVIVVVYIVWPLLFPVDMIVDTSFEYVFHAFVVVGKDNAA